MRDWATFALGTQSELDTPQIRDALAARLEDDDAEDDIATSGEAMLGLASRRDPRVAPYLRRWLDGDVECVGNLTIEAVGAFGDATFLPRLRELKELGRQNHDPRPDVLDDAIAALEAPEGSN